MGTKIIYIILTLLIAILAAWVILAVINNEDEVDTDQEIPDLSNGGNGNGEEVPAGFEQYSNEELGFSIVYPDAASVQTETRNRIKFTFLGPDAEEGTEITDGFVLTISMDPNSVESDDLRSYAESRVQAQLASSDDVEITSSLEARTVNGMPAFRYSYETVLGSIATEYVFIDQNGQGYTASYTIADPNNRGYEGTILTMLESIEFTGGVAVFQAVDIAVLDFKDTGEETTGKERGCDRVVLVEHDIEPTTAPLTAALRGLFSLESETVDGWHNFIAKTNNTLSFERAAVIGGTANIYLTGSLSGLEGVCDNPRASIQIEETALQFPSVTNVQIYLNNEKTSLVPSEQS